ncbi:MAG: MBL fold metallo-hydrolase [Alphaproteobacteria bacterium]|nr:MBL fold metallo-hydrolase [Alphaproteobacteria bacterium]
MKVTVLGCGSSLGTPSAGGFWGKCDPDEPKNRRTRASILVQSETTNLLIDATVDVRTHLNGISLKKLDGVLLTHDHSDHVNGLDDLRPIAYHGNNLIDVYSHNETLEEIDRRWPYLFRPKANGIYVEFLRKRPVGYDEEFRIGDIDIATFEQDHTTCSTLGFRFGDFAYSVDVANLSDAALAALEGVETWIIDSAAYQKEAVGTHANFQRIFEWTERLKPKMTYLTVLTTHMDYKTLCDELPPHIRPAYDGMVVDMEGNRR